MTSTLTTTLRRLALVGALGAGLFGIAAPAGADPFPAGPGDLTTCVDVDIDGQPNCPNIPDPIDDFTAPTPPEDVPGDDDGGSVDGGDELPPAPVGDVVGANPTFTG